MITATKCAINVQNKVEGNAPKVYFLKNNEFDKNIFIFPMRHSEFNDFYEL